MLDTFPFVYECARKQGTLPKLALSELGACGQCAAEVINAKGGEVDLQQNKSCQICYGCLADPQLQAEKDMEKSLEPMKQLIGCCGQGIKSHLEGQKQAEDAGEGRTEPSRSSKPDRSRKPGRSSKPGRSERSERSTNQPPEQARMPRPPTKDEILYHQFDEYDSDMLLPRRR